MDVGDPGALALTLRALIAAGAPLERVLPAFTQNPARLLRLARKGAIRVGHDADLVVLDDNGGVTDVMALGVWQVRDGQVAVHGTFESAMAAGAGAR